VLHKCANPSCSSLFRRLNQGKLFQVETEYFAASNSRRTAGARLRTPRVEHYWLCDTCAVVLTLSFEKGRGLVTVPLPECSRHKHAAAAQPNEPNHTARPAVKGIYAPLRNSGMHNLWGGKAG